jgi:hypothetical protein
MTSKEFRTYMNKNTNADNQQRLKNLTYSLAKMGVWPTYSTPATGYEVALCLWVYAACPVTHHSKLEPWLKNQVARILAGIDKGKIEEAPYHLIGDILADYKKAKEVDRIAIDKETGAIVVMMQDGSRKKSNYSTIHSDGIKPDGIRELTIFPGEFISMLAMMIRVGEAGASVERDKAAQAAREQLKAIVS